MTEPEPLSRHEPSRPDPSSLVSPDPADKAAWRALLLRRRREVPADVRVAEARSLATAAVAACAGVGVVCAYVPIGGEPGSPAMLEALRAAGHEVLLPIIPAGPQPRGALGWGRYRDTGSLVPGPHGLREPAGPDLGPDAIADAGLVLVPALAVDHEGVRLGRGAGWYDRSLPLARPGTAFLAVVRDDEVVPLLPHEPHDMPVTGMLTPRRGLRPLPTR